MMEKTLQMNLLFDFYAPLLTERQRDVFRMYFHEDLSLGEISEQLEVSRQAVHDLLKRVQTALGDFEAKLRLLEKHQKQQIFYEQALCLLAKEHWEELAEQIRQAQRGS